MMALAPETLPRHELAGLPVEVTGATNPDLVGITGRVRRETAHTLYVEGADGVSQVPKAEATFAFAILDGDQLPADRKVPDPTSNEDVTYVTVAGDRLVSRPAERTELRGDTIWESD